MSNIFKYDRDDLLDLLAGVLKRGQISDRKSKAQRLLEAAESSAQQYRLEKGSNFQHGEVRKSLLLLWRAAERGEPKPTLLDLMTTSAPGTVKYLTQRAERLWPSLGLGPLFQSELPDWAQTATQHELATMLIHCCAEGRQFIEGRKRPQGKNSAGKFEPIILGLADGGSGNNTKRVPIVYTDPSFKPAPQISKAGRPTVDAELDLILHLANDWYRITETFKAGGRSDHNPMVEFITSVFQWAGIMGVENALRVYWAELKFRKPRSAPDIRLKPSNLTHPDADSEPAL
jgi:hypothetical protein